MSKKLLLADDSVTIQKVVELILADEDYEIKASGDGEEAWNMVKEFRPDVILADIEMPSLNGYQLCERVKKDEETCHIPVILLAGAFEPIDEDLAREVNADDHLVKPFESQELISKLNAIFAEQEISGETGAEAVEEAVEVSEVAGIEGTGEGAQEEVPEPLEVAEALEMEATAGSVPEAEEIKPEEGEIPFESADEDVWNLEEELSFGEDKPEEETIELIEPVEEEVQETPQAMPEVAPVEEAESPRETPPAESEPPEPSMAISVPEAAEIESMIKETIEKKISDVLSGINTEALRSDAKDLMAEEVKRALSGLEIGNLLEETIRSHVAERIEQAIQADLPQKIEGAIRSMMEDLSSSLRQEVEKILWETVPDLAETLIAKEIQRIKAEF
jgi:CheY-like chemotaxis protein